MTGLNATAAGAPVSSVQRKLSAGTFHFVIRPTIGGAPDQSEGGALRLVPRGELQHNASTTTLFHTPPVEAEEAPSECSPRHRPLLGRAVLDSFCAPRGRRNCGAVAGGSSHCTPARARRFGMSLRTLVYALCLALCLSSIGYMLMKPTPWFRARKKIFAAELESPLLPGKNALKVVFLGLPALLVALLALIALAPKITATKPPRRRCSANVLALCLWTAVQLGWQVTLLMRNGSAIDWKWLKSFAKSFGLSATINVQLILVPVSRSSPVLRLLGVPSEGLVYAHRFLGIGTALLLVIHGALYMTAWSFEGKLVKELLDWPAKGVANLPGELAFLASVALYVFSRPSVRRRSFELFAYTHRAAAVAFFAGAALHWSGFLWFTLPGTLLYLADYAVHLRTSKARVEHVRLNSGVLSLTLSCPPLVRGGRPLQWIMLKVPSISRDWHPFSLSGSPHDSSGTTVSLSIGVIDGGWTQALSERLGSADGVASTQVLLSGCYGLGFDFDVYDAGSPLLLVCGGSGGTPFSALLSAIARRPAVARPPPITLVWICRSRSELDEYVRAGDLMQLSRACDAISLVFYVSQPGAAPRASAKAPTLTLALSPAAAEGQTAKLAAPSATSGRGRGRFDAHTQLAILCHVCMSAGTIGGMAVGTAFYPKEGAAPAQLVGFLLGACAGALAAHAGFACLSIDLRRCRSRLRSASLAALRRAKVGGARTLPAHAETRRVDELAAAPYACVMEADEAGADTRPTDADVREGRPDIETILQAFEARVSCDLAGGAAAPLEMKCHSSPCHTLVSGPAGLVREVSQAARSRGHVVHAVSFAV